MSRFYENESIWGKISNAQRYILVAVLIAIFAAAFVMGLVVGSHGG